MADRGQVLAAWAGSERYSGCLSLRLSPDSADAWGNLGSSYRVLGRRREAIEAYERALAIRADHPVALEGFARMGLSPPRAVRD